MPKYTLFASQKKRDLGFHRYGIPSYFSFPKQSFIEPHTVISEVYFNNRVFHSLIFGVIFGVIPNFLSTFFMFLVHFFLSTFSCPLSGFSVHHLHNLAYLFIVLGFTLGFTLGFILGFTLNFGVHIIVLVTINSCLNHLSQTIKICSSIN